MKPRHLFFAVAIALLASCGPWAVGYPCKSTDDCGGVLICYGGQCMDAPGGGDAGR